MMNEDVAEQLLIPSLISSPNIRQPNLSFSKQSYKHFGYLPSLPDGQVDRSALPFSTKFWNNSRKSNTCLCNSHENCPVRYCINIKSQIDSSTNRMVYAVSVNAEEHAEIDISPKHGIDQRCRKKVIN